MRGRSTRIRLLATRPDLARTPKGQNRGQSTRIRLLAMPSGCRAGDERPIGAEMRVVRGEKPNAVGLSGEMTNRPFGGWRAP